MIAQTALIGRDTAYWRKFWITRGWLVQLTHLFQLFDAGSHCRDGVNVTYLGTTYHAVVLDVVRRVLAINDAGPSPVLTLTFAVLGLRA